MGYLARRMHTPHLATDVTALTKSYTPGRRAMDTLIIVLFFCLEAFILFRSWGFITEHPIISLILSFFGYVAADFISGLVHWIGDTWGNPSMPIVGQYFIRPFREHHVDQTAITRHPFTETNGANCLETMVILLPTVAFLSASASPLVLGFHVFAFAMTMGVFGTNQFHKWSHLPVERQPKIIKALQKVGLILAPKHHAKHHAAPHDTYYCITVGWLNPILAKIKFFKGMEWLITKITGVIPRKNDIVLTATKAAAKVEGVIEGVKDSVTEVMDEVGESIQPKHQQSSKL
jgi:ubiquitin-conjugating enzyme E2 variant